MSNQWDAGKALILLETLKYGPATFEIQNETNFLAFTKKLPSRIFESTPFKRQQSLSRDTINYTEPQLITYFCSLVFMLTESETERLLKEDLVQFSSDLKFDQSLIERLHTLRSEYFKIRRNDWALLSEILIRDLEDGDAFHAKAANIVDGYMSPPKLYDTIKSHISSMNLWYPTGFGLDKLPIFPNAEDQQAFYSSHLHAWVFEYLHEVICILNVLISLIYRRVSLRSLELPELFFTLFVNGFEQISSIISEISSTLTPYESEEIKNLVKEINFKSIALVVEACQFWRTFSPQAQTQMDLQQMGGLTPTVSGYLLQIFRLAHSKSASSLFFSSSLEIMAFFVTRLTQLAQDVPVHSGDDLARVEKIADAFSVKYNLQDCLNFNNVPKDLNALTLSFFGAGGLSQDSGFFPSLLACLLQEGLGVIIRHWTLIDYSYLSDVVDLCQLVYNSNENLCQIFLGAWYSADLRRHYPLSQLLLSLASQSTHFPSAFLRLVSTLSCSPQMVESFLSLLDQPVDVTTYETPDSLSYFVANRWVSGEEFFMMNNHQSLAQSGELRVRYNYTNENPNAFALFFGEGRLVEATVNDRLYVIRWTKPQNWWTIMLYYLSSFNSIFARDSAASPLTAIPGQAEARKDLIDHTRLVVTSVLDLIRSLSSSEDSKNRVLKRLNGSWNSSSLYLLLLQHGRAEIFEQLASLNVIPSVVLLYSSQDLQQHLEALNVSTAVAEDLVRTFSKVSLLDNQDPLSFLKCSLSRVLSRTLINQLVLSSYKLDQQGLYINSSALSVLGRATSSALEFDLATLQFIEVLETIHTLARGQLILSLDLLQEFGLQFGYFNEVSPIDPAQVVSHHSLFRILVAVSYGCSHAHCFKIKTTLVRLAACLYENCHPTSCHIYTKLQVISQFESLSSFSDSTSVAQHNVLLSQIDRLVESSDSYHIMQSQMGSFLNALSLFIINELNEVQSVDVRLSQENFRSYFVFLDALLKLFLEVLKKSIRLEDCSYIKLMLGNASFLQLLATLATLLPSLSLHAKYFASEKTKTLKDLFKMEQDVSPRCLPLDMTLLLSTTTSEAFTFVVRSSLDLMLQISTTSLDILYSLLSSASTPDLTSNLSKVLIAPCALLSNLHYFTALQYNNTTAFVESTSAPVANCSNFCALLSLINLHLGSEEIELCRHLRLSSLKLTSNLISIFPMNVQSCSFLNVLGASNIEGLNVLLVQHLQSDYTSAEQIYYVWSLLSRIAEFHPDILCLLLQGDSLYAEVLKVLKDSTQLYENNPLMVYFVLSFIRHLILKSKDFPTLKKITLKLALEPQFFSYILQPLLSPLPQKVADVWDDFAASSKFNSSTNIDTYDSSRGRKVVDQAWVDKLNTQVTASCYKTLVLSKCLQILSMERYGLLNALDREDGQKFTSTVSALLSSADFKRKFSSWIKSFLSIQYDDALVNNFTVSLKSALGIHWTGIQSCNLINFLAIGESFAVQGSTIKSLLGNATNYFELTSYHNDSRRTGLSAFFCDKVSHLYNESIGMNFMLSITSCDLQLLNYYHEFLNVFIIPRSSKNLGPLAGEQFYHENYSYDIVCELMSTILLTQQQISSQQSVSVGQSLPTTYLGLITVNEKVSLLMTMLHHQLREIQFKDLVPEQSQVAIRNLSVGHKYSISQLETNLNSLIDLYCQCFDTDSAILIEFFSDEAGSTPGLSYPKKNSIPITDMVSPSTSHVNALKLQIRIKLLTIILYSLTTLIDSNRNYSLKNDNLLKIFDSSLKLQQKIFEVYGLDILKSLSVNHDLYSTLNDCGITKKDIQSLIQLTFQLINLTLPALSTEPQLASKWIQHVESSQLALYLVRLFNQLSISNSNYPYEYCQFLNSPHYKYDIIENIVRSNILLPLKRTDSSSKSHTNKNNAISLFDYIEVETDRKIVYNEGLASLQYIILIFTRLIESGFLTHSAGSYEYLIHLLTHIIDSPLFSNLIHVLYVQLNIGSYDLKSSINTLLDITNAQILAPLLGYNSVNFEEDLLFKLWENILILLERVIILNAQSKDANGSGVVHVVTSLIQRHYLLFLLPLCLSSERRYSLRQLELVRLTFSFFNVLNTYIPLWTVYIKEFYLIVRSLTKGLISDWINLLTSKGKDEVTTNSAFLRRFLFVSPLEYKSVSNIVSKISDDLLALDSCSPTFDLSSISRPSASPSAGSMTKTEMSITLYYKHALYQNMLVLFNFLRQILPLPVEHFDLNRTVTVGSNVFFMSNNTNTLMQGTVSRVYTTNQPPPVSEESNFTYNNNNFIKSYDASSGTFTLYDIVLTNQLLERGVSLSQIRYVNYPLCEFISEKKLDELVASNTPYISEMKSSPALYLGHNPNEGNDLDSKYYLTTAHLFKFIKYLYSPILQKRLEFFDQYSDDLQDQSRLILMESFYLLIANLDHHSFAPNYREKKMLVVVEDLINSSLYHLSGGADSTQEFVKFSNWPEWQGYSSFCRHWLEEIEFRLRRSLGVTIYYNEELTITPENNNQKKRIGLRAKVEWVKSYGDI